MVLAAPGLPPAGTGRVRHARNRTRRDQRRSDQPRARPALRPEDGAHAPPADPDGPCQCPPGARLRGGARRGVDDRARDTGQRADRRAHLRLADRLRGALHRLAQARDAAEHRDRRRRGRRATGARLDRGHRAGRAACAAALPDHLRVDTAALLGAGDRAPRRLREGRHPDAAGCVRGRIHAPADPALHDPARDRHGAAVYHGHDRTDLSRGCARCSACSSPGTRSPCGERTPRRICRCRCSGTR